MTDEPEVIAHELKAKLEALNERKEDAFRRKQEISQKIADKIKLVSDYKKSRNELTKGVRELKVERDKLNSQITAKIGEIKSTQPKEKPVQTGERVNVHELQRQMRALEQKIETVPMSFDAEQKTMKQIKAIKKQLDAVGAVHKHNSELATKSKEIDQLKSSANALHAKVTQMAKQSQDHHEKLIQLSKEIEELKAQEDTVYQEFLAAKQEYMMLSGDMKKVQSEVKAVKAAVREQKEKAKKQKDAEDQKTLLDRAREAEAKMARGEKLTTEDLLALQSLKE